MAFDTVIDKTQLETAIKATADAIREKTGTTDPITWLEELGFSEAIAGIQSGGGGDIDTLINKSITEVSSDVTSIGRYAFCNCTALKTIDFPAVTSIEDNAFYNCTALTTICFPVATSIGSYGFQACSKLTKADFPVATSIGSYGFYSCTAMTALILRRTENICKLSNKNALLSSAIASSTGYIYVPAALIDSYKAATNWSNYASQFRTLEDYTIDGTTTGDLDPNKI